MRVPTSRLSLAALATAAGLLIAAAAPSPAQPVQVNAHAAAVKAFQDRLQGYLQLRDKATKGIPDLAETKDPRQVNAREQAIGAAIKAARAAARPGDLFGRDELRAFIVERVRADWKRRSPADRRSLMSEVPKGLNVRVNMTYPPTLPLGTFPALLLEQLPQLPDGLEYRFMGPHLVLRDSSGNIVIDVLPNVVATT